MKYYSSKTVTKILGVTAQTLRNWDKVGKILPLFFQYIMPKKKWQKLSRKDELNV